MAKNKYLDLTVRIAGKMDKSLMQAINGTRNNLSDLAQTVSRIGTVGLAAMGALATGTVAALAKCTDAAKDFEAQMADVVKYVDGLADANGRISDSVAENGKTFKQNYADMSDAILELSTQIPMTAEDLTRLAAAAGQSGKSITDLIEYDENGNISGFLRDVAMMGTAMDISADQAGDWAAKWEKAFAMNHDEVMVVADQINYLGANTATTAAEIAQVVNEAASLGQVAGMDVSSTAALADAMLAMGVDTGKAANAISRMYVNLSKGYSATKAQKTQWEALGFTAEGIAKSMQTDATGTIIDVFEAIQALDTDKQVAALSTLFGQWAIKGAAKLTGNLGTFTDALNMVNDPNLYNGSMEREFIIKASNSEAIDTMMANAFQATKIDIGTAFLPAKKEMSLAIIDFLNQLRKMPELGQVANTLAEIFSEGIRWAGDALERALPYIQQALAYLRDNGPQVLNVLKKLALTFTGMKFAPGIVNLLGGLGGLLTGGSGKGGGLFGAIGSVFKGGQSFFGKAGSYISTGAASMAENGIGTSLLAAKNTLFNIVGNSKIAQGVKGVGGYFGGIGASIGKLGGAILNPASASAPITLGSTGPMAAIGGLMGNVKNVAGAGAGVFSSVLGPFARLLSGALPVVGIISSIIAVVSILNDKFDLLGKIFNAIFGEEGPQKLESFKTTLDNVFNGDGLIQALAPVRDAITGMFGENAGAAFGGLAQILQSIMGVVGQVVTFAQTTVKPIIQDIFNFITTTVVPVLLQTFTAAAPYISGIITNLGTAIMTVAQYIGQAIQAAMPYIQAIISTVLSIGSVVIPALLAAFEGLTGMLQPIIDNIKQVLDGIIQAVQGILDFVTGVFTGDWDKAWQGVRDIFGGIWSALEGLVKAPINAIIGIINGAISGINAISFTIPDWSPIWPGQKIGFNIPTIPYLAKGGFTTGPSIAGEAGTEAVISFQRSARAQNIDIWRQAGRMLGMNRLAEVPTVPAAPAGGGFEISFSPHIEIKGNADRAVVDQALKESEYRFQAWLEANFDRLYDRMTRDRGRRAYA